MRYRSNCKWTFLHLKVSGLPLKLLYLVSEDTYRHSQEISIPTDFFHL